jgi:toxin FitB
MSFLLDTNIVSEWVKPKPDPGVITWLAEVDEDRVFLSVVSLAELRFGVARMPAGTRRNRLDSWLRDELPLRFDSRILPVTALVAEAWGQVVARSLATGRTMGIMDGFLAATADVHHLTIVTRNVSDFAVLGDTVLNPWSV